MFNRAYEFNQDLSNWDVARVTNMDEIFDYARSFSADLTNWQLSPEVKKGKRWFVAGYWGGTPNGGYLPPKP